MDWIRTAAVLVLDEVPPLLLSGNADPALPARVGFCRLSVSQPRLRNEGGMRH